MLTPSFFERCAVDVARDLLGCNLTISGVGGTIVETEAYTRDDPASHSYRGPTLRCAAMFGAPGSAYVYRSYGVHWCLNVVCLPGQAVLFRALEPLVGLQIMVIRRNTEVPTLLCSGPGRIGQALGVGLHHNTHPLEITPSDAGPVEVLHGPRIGITRAADRPWRFGMRGSKFLSRRF